MLNDEFERTEKFVLKVSGQPELLSNNPVSPPLPGRTSYFHCWSFSNMLITLREQNLSDGAAVREDGGAFPMETSMLRVIVRAKI